MIIICREEPITRRKNLYLNVKASKVENIVRWRDIFYSRFFRFVEGEEKEFPFNRRNQLDV